MRALPTWPASYTVEAFVLTTPVDTDNGVRRWQVHTADERPVALTDRDGTNPRAWLLRENCFHDISHDDVEGG
ncbi:hypothetical protein [Saccharothrix tamanrassetensis]|uniref:hypothetical protein n=1 Tax=Saccharothrix tamanrassetensis TaxID=1051531 RepID=UPI001C88BDF8|nr:hypothetical protein [Saccharothrix tamanrassetensis]